MCYCFVDFCLVDQVLVYCGWQCGVFLVIFQFGIVFYCQCGGGFVGGNDVVMFLDIDDGLVV